jgi:plasmid stabilization system protein ParE
MAYKIRWTKEANETFDKIIEYLENRWTGREIVNFINKTNQILKQISEHPEMFKSSSKMKIRMGIITKQTSIFYQIDIQNKTIVLLSFWDNRQDHSKQKY